MTRILVLCPTRQRPANATRLYNTFQDTTGPNTHLVFCVDNDDPKLEEYNNRSIPMIVGEPNRLGPWLNKASAKFIEMSKYDPVFNPPYDIIGFVGDDVLPNTYGWDVEVAKAMKPNGVVYPNDGFQGENLPTSVFMDTALIDELGYMVYPELNHLYIDNHWKSLGNALGTLTYLEHVDLEHLHPFAGKATSDEVYDKANAPAQYSADYDAYCKFETDELTKVVERLG